MPRKSFRDTLQDRRLGTMAARGTGPLRRESDLVVANLVFEPQPRWIVLPRVLQDLIAQGLNRPPAVLARLQELAAGGDPHSQQVLAGLETLAASIRAQGVIDPIIFHYREEGGPAVVDDGHRRSLAAHLAGLQTIPGVERAGLADPLERHLAQLTTSLEREDLTAIELACQVAMLRDELVQSLQAGAVVGGPEATESTVAAEFSLLGSTETTAPGDFSCPRANETTAPAASLTPRAAQARARDIILSRLPRLGHDYYYRLLRLVSRLAPAAQEAALQSNLTEAQLRPVVDHVSDPDQQVACIQAIAAHELTRREASTLVRAVLEGADPAAAAARLAQAPPTQPAARTAAPAVPMPEMHRRAQPVWRKLHRTACTLEGLHDPATERRLQGLSPGDLAHIHEQAQAVQAAAARVLEQTARLLEPARDWPTNEDAAG